MISKLPVLVVSGALALSCAAHADDATFKAYGFADVELLNQTFRTDNSLVLAGIVDPNTQLYLDHLNTYLDWKPNSNIRVLAEIAYNPDPAQTFVPGMKLHADSVAIFNDILKKSGSPTDSLSRAGIAAGTHQLIQVINGIGAIQQPSSSTKDHGISLPRVHADLLLADEFNVRVGKFLTPAGIWNVDHGSPTILTIKQPYETNFFQIFPVSQTGVQFFGHTPAGDNDLSYATWVTTGRAGAGIASDGDYAEEPENLDDWAAGAHLQADLAYLDGIRLGGTFHTGTHREYADWFSPAVTSSTFTTDLADANFSQIDTVYNRELCYGLDSKIQWKGFILQTEWNHRQVLNLLADRAETNFDAEYVLLGRRFPLGTSLDVTPYVMFENITWTGAANNPYFGLGNYPTNGFSDYLAGLNFGIFNNVRVKLEYSRQQIQARQISSGSIANTYTNNDLSFNQYAAQFSVAF